MPAATLTLPGSVSGKSGQVVKRSLEAPTYVTGLVSAMTCFSSAVLPQLVEWRFSSCDDMLRGLVRPIFQRWEKGSKKTRESILAFQRWEGRGRSGCVLRGYSGGRWRACSQPATSRPQEPCRLACLPAFFIFYFCNRKKKMSVVKDTKNETA